MWKLIQCAVQGRGHVKENIPCQDKTCVYHNEDVSITALADGAGSAKLSHFGAEDITHFMCIDIAKNFDSYYNNNDGVEVKKELVSKIHSRLIALAKEIECEFNDLSSTLLITAVKDVRYLIVHIGDGVIGYIKDDQIKIASQPENGEFVNTTVFTTSKNVLQTIKILRGKLDTITGFVSISDGTEAMFL